MRVDDIFPPESIEEDFKKWLGGAMAAGALAGGALGPTANAYHEKVPVVKTDPMAKQIATLGATMWGEARSHGPLGMLAVGYVIKNRAASDEAVQHKYKFGGHDVASVATQPKQFSCWNPSDPNRNEISEMRQIDQLVKTKTSPPGEKSYEDWFSKFKLTNTFRDYIAWNDAFNIAKKIMSGSVEDPTNGALFYHVKNIHPAWAKHWTPSSHVANHVFYRLPKHA